MKVQLIYPIRLISPEVKTKAVLMAGKIITSQEALDLLKEADLRAIALQKITEREKNATPR